MPLQRLSLVLICLAIGLAGCQAQPGTAALAGLKANQAAEARAAMPSEDLALVRELALDAHAALALTEEAYKGLALDTAHGRKLTPARETLVRSGLLPVITRLEEVSGSIQSRLAAHATPRMNDLRTEFDQRPPQADQALPTDVAASDLLYRVAQYRLKLSFLLEYALRKGALAGLPGKRSAPSSSPLPGA